MYLKLAEYVYCNGQILFNLLSGSRYELNDVTAQIVQKLDSGMDIETAMRLYSSADIDSIIKQLIEMEYVYILDTPSLVPKIQMHNSTVLTSYLRSPFKLFSLTIELTGKCNMDCIFCNSSNLAYRTCGCKKWHYDRMLSDTQWKDIAKQATELGAKNIVFSGGEPMLRKILLFDLISYFRSKNITISIFTNGSLLDKDSLQFLAKNEVTLNIQILSSNINNYRILTGSEKGYNDISNTISYIKSLKIQHNIILLWNSINATEFDTIRDALGAQLRYIDCYLYPSNKYHPKTLREKMNNHIPRLIALDLNNLEYRKNFNMCFFGSIFIATDGSVYPCMMLRRESFGVLGDKQLYEVFLNHEYAKYWNLSNFKLTQCVLCKYAICCNNCRAVECAHTADITTTSYCDMI